MKNPNSPNKTKHPNWGGRRVCATGRPSYVRPRVAIYLELDRQTWREIKRHALMRGINPGLYLDIIFLNIEYTGDAKKALDKLPL